MLMLMPTAYGLLSVRRRLGRAPQWKYLIWGPTVLLGRIFAGDHALLRVRPETYPKPSLVGFFLRCFARFGLMVLGLASSVDPVRTKFDNHFRASP